jgi:tellurite resistance protein TehA-like permease
MRRALATLDPDYFALVMATGIISIGAALMGYQTLSQVILGLTVAAFVILAVAYAARLVWFPGWVAPWCCGPSGPGGSRSWCYWESGAT